jgi:hypothetical protein
VRPDSSCQTLTECRQCRAAAARAAYGVITVAPAATCFLLSNIAQFSFCSVRNLSGGQRRKRVSNSLSSSDLTVIPTGTHPIRRTT